MVNGNGISFSGLASGLDTQAIIAQLVALERIPIQLIELKKETEQKRLDLVGSFADLVKDLKAKADALATSNEFYVFGVSVSQEGVANIGASNNATPGSHSLEVTNVASIDRWAFDAVVDPDADLASANGQQLSFDANGTTYNLTVDIADSSLNEIAAAINGLGEDVEATVVNEGTDANPSYRLVMASTESGEDFRITNISSGIAGLTIDSTPSGPSNITVGNNAVAVIDGLTIERSDNDFGDVIPGVSIDILSTTAIGEEITFTVDADKEAIKGKIQAFVDSYNTVITFINQQNTYTPPPEEGEAGIAGELFGNSILSTVRTEINRSLFNVPIATVLADTEGYSTLSLIGIKQDNDGKLSIDEGTFDDKFTANLGLLADLFVDTDGFDNGGAAPNSPDFWVDQTADSGLADTLSRMIGRMFGTLDGPPDGLGGYIALDALFDAKEDAMQSNIDLFDDQIEAMERRLEGFEDNLVLRFARLEELMGQLNAQGAALSNALIGLPNSNN